MKDYKLFVEKVLQPSQYRKYVVEFNKERYADIFKKYKEMYDGDKNAYRIYIPLIETKRKGKAEKEIKTFLKEKEYEIVDYINGKCKHMGAKNLSKIGQVLTRLGRTDLLDKFNEDPDRKHGEDLMVCISRHPYDIAGSDTDRRWTNCMTLGTKMSPRLRNDIKELRTLKIKIQELQIDKLKLQYEYEDLEEKKEDYTKVLDKIKSLDNETKILNKKVKDVSEKIDDRKNNGCNSKYLLYDVKRGSLISYLIKKSDIGITDPIANLNIKPYINQTNSEDFLLKSDKNWYGEGTKAFKKTVDNWLEEVNGVKEGVYKMDEYLYDDSEFGYIFKIKDKSIEKLKEFIDNCGDTHTFMNIILADKEIEMDAKKQLIEYTYERIFSRDSIINWIIQYQIKGIAKIFNENDLWNLIYNYYRNENGNIFLILPELQKKIDISYQPGDFTILFNKRTIKDVDCLRWFDYECHKRGFLIPNNETARIYVLNEFRKMGAPLTEEENEILKSKSSILSLYK
jgi:hypothetical protein